MSFSIVKTIRQNLLGQRRQVVLTIKGPSSYTAGGEPNTVEKLSGGRIKEADFIHLDTLSYSETYRAYISYGNTDGGVRDFQIKVFVVATGAEAGAIDLSAEKWRVEIQGN